MNYSCNREKIQSSIHCFQICPTIKTEISAQQRAHSEQNNNTSKIKYKDHRVSGKKTISDDIKK